MRVADVMTPEPACCTGETTVQEAAASMAEHDCGCLPVVDADGRVAGVVTDRDIACRCVANGKEPTTPVGEVMTSPARCCGPDDDAVEAARVMAQAQVRRVPVIDRQGCCVGMVSQADLARAGDLDRDETTSVVERVSEPTAEPAQPGAATAGRLAR